MQDFEVETVGLFLTLLSDEEVTQIEERNFRELHKMSVVFEVEWLRWDCVRWLSGRMKIGLDDDGKYFLFDECLFIVKKWDDWDLMNSFILKIASVDNSSFITRYFQDFDKLEAVQIQLMLQLGGNNCKLFLQILLQHLKRNTELGVNAKILLEKMNLVLCSQLENKLYTEVTDKIPRLTLILFWI